MRAQRDIPTAIRKHEEYLEAIQPLIKMMTECYLIGTVPVWSRKAGEDTWVNETKWISEMGRQQYEQLQEVVQQLARSYHDDLRPRY